MIIAQNNAIAQFPMEPNNWLIGHISMIQSTTEKRMRVWTLLHKYPRYMAFRLTFLMPVLAINHPDIIRQVIRSNVAKKFINESIVRPVIGDALPISTGEKWRNHRKILDRAFHSAMIRSYIKTTNSCVDILIGIMKKDINAMNCPDVFSDVLDRYIADVVFNCLLSRNENIQLNKDTPNTVRNIMKFLTKELSVRIQSKYLLVEPIYALTQNGKKYKSQIKTLHEYVEKMIAQRKYKDSHNEDRRSTGDLLDIMLNTVKSDGKLMNDEEIKDEVECILILNRV